MKMVLTTDEHDFETAPYEPTTITSTADLQQLFEKELAGAREVLTPEKESVMNETWTLRSGESIFSANSKADMIRHAFNQIVHHRAQLGVYFRLLNIAVPASYGPSADDAGM